MIRSLIPARPITIPVPGLQHRMGAGDIVANFTRALRMTPCEPCKKRQELLNQILQLQQRNR